MKKIFISTPYSRDANSFWRCMGPLSYLSKHSEGEIEIYLAPDGTSIGWDRLDQFDLVFMHRPCRPADVTLMRLARLLNIPVWSDYDDWLFHLPQWNPATSIYHQHQVQEIMALCMACSDVISVSTGALQKQISTLNPHTVILPNAYRSDLYPFRQKTPPERKDIYLWRGTNTHDGDIMSVGKAFTNFTKPVHFFGTPPYTVMTEMDPKNYQKMDPVDPLMYWKAIYQKCPKVWLFPLDDCFFNRCKSNISWIEALHAGAITVAPKLPEWQHLGVITYEPNNWMSFFEAAEEAMAMDSTKLSQIVVEAYDYMRSKLDITIVNQHRMNLVNSIFHPTFERNTRDPFNQLTGTWALSVLKGETLPVQQGA